MKGKRKDLLWLVVLLVAGGVVGGGYFLAGIWPSDTVPAAAETAARAPVDQIFDSRFKAGIAKLRSGQPALAASMFRIAAKRQPHIPEVHVNLGFTLLDLGNPKAAESAFRRGINLRGGQVNAYYGLAESLEIQGRLDEALGAMRTYIHLTPEEDPFRRRAMSAVWEWRDRMAQKQTDGRGKTPPAEVE